jgi:hypothetical protein
LRTRHDKIANPSLLYDDRHLSQLVEAAYSNRQLPPMMPPRLQPAEATTGDNRGCRLDNAEGSTTLDSPGPDRFATAACNQKDNQFQFR